MTIALGACAEDSPPISKDSNSTSSTTPTPNPNPNPTPAPTNALMTVSAAESVSLADCSSSASKLVIKVVGGGSAVKGCLDFGVGTACEDKANFSLLSQNGEWTYNSLTDTWTYNFLLQSRTTYRPGSYFWAVLGTDGTTVKFTTFTIATANTYRAGTCDISVVKCDMGDCPVSPPASCKWRSEQLIDEEASPPVCERCFDCPFPW